MQPVHEQAFPRPNERDFPHSWTFRAPERRSTDGHREPIVAYLGPALSERKLRSKSLKKFFSTINRESRPEARHEHKPSGGPRWRAKYRALRQLDRLSVLQSNGVPPT